METQTMEQTEAQALGQQQPQQTTSRVAPSSVGTKVVASSQPLLALSGLGLAYGSLKSVVRKIKRATSLNTFKLPKIVKTIPKYMRNNYIKYPILFMVFLAATRRVRSAINH